MDRLSCILLVDDDQTTTYLSQLLLERCNVADKILVASNGRAALDLLLQLPAGAAPSLILLDVHMPVMDGYAFAEAYAQLPAATRQALVVVMLTTPLHPASAARLQQHNVLAFVQKPLNADKLSRLLRTHFSGSVSVR
ncbi:response regulator [Hymenobacter psychrotolerans]|uniref:Response regulator receiver domain-containing protein n=1 Tax=Hymenobacter psychrotolerans DSM 18569 TaxID=1121959 RepID=A0A1M6V774_9BACT|nr:response regulator [Hymenobacter psychrotolerans]SHK77357.1 Response regulator receiver domain-containing protein [Hymenobacter psychrotolerans DSM 18569]